MSHRWLTMLMVVSLLLAPSSPAFFVAARPAASGVQANTLPGVLFRTTVTLRQPTDRVRLDQLGVVVLSEAATQAVVLADADQLETLARLRFEPTASDELGVLVAANATRQPWLAVSLQPLLAKAQQVASQATQADHAARSDALAALREAVQALSPEQIAGLAAMSSIDDDGDGLTNTQEQWWCTNPLHADSDVDGVSDGSEIQLAKDWLANKRSSPPSSGKPFAGWPMQGPNGTVNPLCDDSDYDGIPDNAETWELGLNRNRESTDWDKYDDGNELFGITPPNWSLPLNVGLIINMPPTVKAPGTHPLVAAHPQLEITLTSTPLHVETAAIINIGTVIGIGEERNYSTSDLRGISDSAAQTVSFTDWQEASVAFSQPALASPEVAQYSAPSCYSPRPAPTPTPSNSSFVKGEALMCTQQRIDYTTIPPECYEKSTIWNNNLGGSVGGKVGLIAEGKFDVSYSHDWGGQQNVVSVWSDYWCKTAMKRLGLNIDNDSFNTMSGSAQYSSASSQDLARGFAGLQYAQTQAGDLIASGLHEVAYALNRPRKITTSTQGHSETHAETDTHTEYSERSVTNGNAWTSTESWSTATSTDSSHAANLTFSYNVNNKGTDTAAQLTTLAFNVYIGQDNTPICTYFVGSNECGTPPSGGSLLTNLAPGDTSTFASHPIPLTLDQMRRLDLGETLRVQVERVSFGIDEVFFTNAAAANILVAIEDGADDGDESIDTYLIPTWGDGETVQDVIGRYFPVTTDKSGNYLAVWTPEYRSDTPLWCIEPARYGASNQLWCRHALSTADWWDIYLNNVGEGTTLLKDTLAVPNSAVMFRFNQDSDLDGYSDRSEERLLTDPNDPADYPHPELIGGLHSIRNGNFVTATLSLLNTGLYDAYGVEAVLIAPNESITITNNTVGGSGRVRAQKQVVVGSRIIPQTTLTTTWHSNAQPILTGYYTGTLDRVYTFTAIDTGNVSANTLRLNWSDGLGITGTLNFGAGYASPVPLTISNGVKLGLMTGQISAGDYFTVAAQTPRDTFQYQIVSEPHAEPIVLVSYNDPQGNHRLVLPSTSMHLDDPTANLATFSSQMLQDPGVEIVTIGVYTAGVNTTTLVVNNPTTATLTNAHLFMEFVNISGTVASEVPLTVTLSPGPNVVTTTWNTNVFSPTFNASEDYIAMAFWTDYQGNILDTAARPLSSFQVDPKPAFTMSIADQTWNFGTVTQGTLLKRDFTFANTGQLDLLAYVSAPAGVNLSQAGSRSIGSADMTTYELALNTAEMTLGAYDQTITIRSSDPNRPTQTVHLLGTIVSGTLDTPAGTLQRPLDWSLPLATGSQGAWVQFTHTLGPNPGNLHPVKVYSQNYSTMWGVGKYATNFGIGTFSPDMFGDGRDGNLVVASGQTYFTDNGRATIAGTAGSGQTNLSFLYPSGGQIDGYVNYWPKYQWFDTGIKLTSGDRLRIVKDEHGNSSLGDVCYAGQDNTCYDANGSGELAPTGWTAPGIRKYSLVAKVGNGAPFFVGKSFDANVGGSGPLFLGLNDCDNCFNDNVMRWWYTHQIQVFPTSYAGFSPGDIALIMQTTGAGAGQYEIVHVVSAGTGWVTLAAPLHHTYSTSGASVAQVIRIPQYSSVVVQNGGTIAAHNWSGATGGVVVALVQNQLSIESGGRITASAAGFTGGRETAWSQPNSGPAYQGASYTGVTQQTTTLANGGGGGGGQNDGGGGGGYGTAGQSTTSYGGASYGTSDLSTIFLGSGGGGSGHYYQYAAQGGRGGGSISIVARHINVMGAINADGQGGWQGYYGGYYPAPTAPIGSTRNGGGGSGGSVKLVVGDGSLGTSLVTALGGPGGKSTDNSGNGGDGGVGRIGVEYCDTVSGETIPSANSRRIDCYIAEQVETAPYDQGRFNLPESFSNGRTYQIQYGRRLVFTGAQEFTTTFRISSTPYLTATFNALVSDVSAGNLNLNIDIGNDGTWDWQIPANVNGAATFTSTNLATAFNTYWALHVAPLTGTVDVPVRVSLDKAGQVLLTNLQLNPVGSKPRSVRLSAQTYATVTLDLGVGNIGAGPLTLAVDVGDDGTFDWIWNGSVSFPFNLTSGNLASAFNAYLTSKSGEVDVPVRFYLSPALSLRLNNYHAVTTIRPDATLSASGINFSSTSPTEGEVITVTATVTNTGAITSSGLTTAFFAQAPGWSDWYIGSAYVPSIPANGTAQATIQWNTLGFTGTTPVRVVVDPYNRVAETNEYNNVVTTTLNVLTRPDLSFTSFDLSNDEPVVTETVIVTLPLKNGGQTGAGAESIALYQGNPDTGGVLVDAVNQSGLVGNATTPITFTWTPTSTGKYRLYARADRDGQVNEFDESNNDVWRDVYVGLRGPILIDSGAASDVSYTASRGYGYIDLGQPDAVTTCAGGPTSENTVRRDPDGQVYYRFDHLQPGHFYHLDVTLYECDGAGRQENILVDGSLIAGPEDLGNGQIHRLTLLLDPALYADRTISVTIAAPGIDGAVVSQINLYDVDYRYTDAGGGGDLAYSLSRGYGWLDGVPNTSWGTLPRQSVRVEQTDAELRYRFDRLDPVKRYNLHLSFWQPSGAGRIERVQVDGLDTGLSVNTGDYQLHQVSARVPLIAYQADGSVIVSIVRLNATTGAMVNEIALEEETLPVGSLCSATATPSFSDAFGAVTMNGQALPPGTTVQALNPRGDTVGCFTVSTGGLYGFMHVYGEDTSANPTIPGMRDGELVSFLVDGAPAVATPLFYWHDDKTSHRIDLTTGSIDGQAVLLQANWNLLSFRVEPPAPLVAQVLDSITGRYDRVLGETGVYVPTLPAVFNTLQELHAGRAYYVRVTGGTSANLLLQGLTQPITTPIPLHTGWNWIGYYPTTTLPITIALQSIAGHYQRVLSLDKTFDPALPEFSTLLTLKPGEGYLIFANAPITLTYPIGSGGTLKPEATTLDGCESVGPTPELTIAYGVLQSNGMPASAGTRVEAVTPRGEIAGCGIVHDAGRFGFMHLYGADEVSVGFRPGEIVTWRINGLPTGDLAPLTWQDDKAPHAVQLTIFVHQLYLPLVLHH